MKTEDSEFYNVGMTSNSFATRHRGHKTSFSNAEHKNETSLITTLWEFREKGKKVKIELKIIQKKARPISQGRKFESYVQMRSTSYFSMVKLTMTDF